MENDTKTLSNVVSINDTLIKNHLDGLVRSSVEDTLNALLDSEADAMCNAQRYERSPDRADTRAERVNLFWTTCFKVNVDFVRFFPLLH